jgi:hypothetical protein
VRLKFARDSNIEAAVDQSLRISAYLRGPLR